LFKLEWDGLKDEEIDPNSVPITKMQNAIISKPILDDQLKAYTLSINDLL